MMFGNDEQRSNGNQRQPRRRNLKLTDGLEKSRSEKEATATIEARET